MASMLRLIFTKQNTATALPGLILREFAGHSKWANIKHKKGAEDAKRAKTFAKIAVAIASASQRCKGDINNFLLASAIGKAKLNNVPKANIDAAVQRGVTGKASEGENVTYEGVGPGGVSVIVEALTDNRKRTAPKVRNIFLKFGGALGAEGSAAWQFNRLGCCVVPLPNAKLDADHVFTAAVEAGASDIELLENDSDSANSFASTNEGLGVATAHVLCAPGDLSNVRDGLAAVGHSPALVELIWKLDIARGSSVELAEGSETFDLFGELVNALEDNDDVQSIYHNAT